MLKSIINHFSLGLQAPLFIRRLLSWFSKSLSSIWCKSEKRLGSKMKWTPSKKSSERLAMRGLQQYFDYTIPLSQTFMFDKGRPYIVEAPSNEVVLGFVLAWNISRINARSRLQIIREKIIARKTISTWRRVVSKRTQIRESRESRLENVSKKSGTNHESFLGSKERINQDIVSRSVPTQFPVLGSIETCDCWDCHHEDIGRPLSRFLKTYALFPFNTMALVKSVVPTLLLRRRDNSDNILVTRVNNTFSFYQAKDCHQTSSYNNWIVDHAGLLILRVVLDSLDDATVIESRDWENKFFRNHEDLLEERHAHSKFVGDMHPTMPTGEDIVMSRSENMTRDEKCRLRRERRANNRELRMRGEKPKKIQLPLRYRGLTTQEYHELRLRESESFLEEFKLRGFKSLPQSVKNYLKSGTGSEWWENIHAWYIDRPDFALKSLDKLNKFLMSIGLPYALPLNPNKVETIRKARERNKELQTKQRLAAAASLACRMVGPTKTTKFERLSAETGDFSLTSGNTPWAEVDDDSLPDLDW